MTDTWTIVILLVIVGLCLGSFAGAVVWRLRAGRDFVRERSECDHCGHQLAWYDLVPVLSWLSLAGRCRYCHQRLSIMHPLTELAMAGVVTVSYLIWPFALGSHESIVLYFMWVVCLVLLLMLVLYDARWYVLPDVIVYPLIGFGAIMGLYQRLAVSQMPPWHSLVDMLLGVASIAGVYYVLYAVSRGRWVGFGDVKLGIFMGLTLGWKLGLLAVFIANLLGLLFVLPGLLSGRLSRTSRVPFGPFLIGGYLIAWLAGTAMIDWYLGTMQIVGIWQGIPPIS